MEYLKNFIGSRTHLNSKKWGTLFIESVSFTPATDGDMAVYVGEPFKQESPLIRIHSECVFSEVLESDLCDCHEQLVIAMDRLINERHGILFYLRFDGRGAGLAAKIKATALEINGIDTYDSRVSIGVSPEGRDFSNIGLFLIAKGLSSVRLLTNNPIKIDGLKQAGLEVTAEPLIVQNPSLKVKQLYKTKALKFGHYISKNDFKY